MSHNDYVLPGNAWNGATVPGPEMLAELDQKATAAVNGDEGGVWAPREPIWIGNAGVRAEQVHSLGELRIGRTGRLHLGDALPTFAPPLRRKVLVPLPKGYSVDGPTIRTFDEEYFAIRSAVPDVGAFGVPVTRWMPDRATLVGASLMIRALVRPSSTSNLPLPQFGIWRLNADASAGGDTSSMQPYTTTLGVVLDEPFPTTVDEYFNDGKPYALRWTPSQNNVIDLANFVYTLVVLEARSTNGPVATNIFHSLELTFDVNDAGYT